MKQTREVAKSKQRNEGSDPEYLSDVADVVCHRESIKEALAAGHISEDDALELYLGMDGSA